jgi:FkbH-like protein
MSALKDIFATLDGNPSISAYEATLKKLESVRLEPLRLAILANHTFDIQTALTVECARHGLSLRLYQADYDQYRQELLDPHAKHLTFAPEAILISLNLESAFPKLSFGTCASSQELPAVEGWLSDFCSVLSAYRDRNATPILLQNFIPPDIDMDGLLPTSGARSIFSWAMELNQGISKLAASLPDLYVVDAAKLAFESGLKTWRDRRLFYIAGIGINPRKYPILSSQVARCLVALRHPPAKCLVLDLDNTVWGGILGEVGAANIQCAGSWYPANAYADFQRALLGLRSRGILLAVASKNDPHLVADAFRERSEMPLRPEHITAWEVHWEPKSHSLQRIARRMNIGLESLVFLDDSASEVDLVKSSLPGVRTYQMPARPEMYAEFLAQLTEFDQMTLSKEDMRRPQLYKIQAKQAELAASATDLVSFYRSLQTKITVEKADKSNIDRIVQLFQKTNQFNLTTRRYDKAQLMERLSCGSELWAFRARDVHGDHGIVAVALLEFEPRICRIDSLLVSCRVIGRTLETAVLCFLENRALARGATQIIGEYRATTKNSPCRDFFKKHGFDYISQEGDDNTCIKNISSRRTVCPEWITIQGTLPNSQEL